MHGTNRIQHVNIYRRLRRGDAHFSFLMAESSPCAFEALTRAVETVEGLRREFPDYEFVVLRRGPAGGRRVDQG